jgi:hypothetical protein
MREIFHKGTAGALVLLIAAPALAAVSDDSGRWVPGIGDPTVFGWLTVASYLFAAVMAVSNLPRASRLSWPEKTFWILLSGGLFFLSVNKQLDLQSWFTQIARDMALQQGWYESRRFVQVTFIAALAMSGVAFLAGVRSFLAAKWRAYSLVCLGIGGLVLFVLVRAATFHHIDSLLGTNMAGVSVNFALEMGSIIVIVLGILKWKSMHPGQL